VSEDTHTVLTIPSSESPRGRYGALPRPGWFCLLRLLSPLGTLGLLAILAGVTWAQPGGDGAGRGSDLPVLIDARPDLPDVQRLVQEESERTLADRRWLHEHAELSSREFETQRYVKLRLGEIDGIELIEGDWGTGVVAVLRGSQPGPMIAYRAELDALPLKEESGLPFACASTDTLHGREVGVMHACGHDLHTAMTLGTARVLSRLRWKMPGSILLVFQPAEERGQGARRMIKAGLFRQAGLPEAMYALHVHPGLRVGQVSYCPGVATANADEFHVKILGRGGHGAYPHRSVDPIVIACQTITALQSIVSRELDASETAVITVGSIHGGSASNVIPDEVRFSGTVRTHRRAVRDQLRQAILRTVEGTAAAAGAPPPEVRYRRGSPALRNDPALVKRTLPVLRRVLGRSDVLRYDAGLGAEDFAFFGREVPIFMMRLGAGRPGRTMSLHSSRLDPNEAALDVGVRVMTEVLWAALQDPSHPDARKSETAPPPSTRQPSKRQPRQRARAGDAAN